MNSFFVLCLSSLAYILQIMMYTMRFRNKKKKEKKRKKTGQINESKMNSISFTFYIVSDTYERHSGLFDSFLACSFNSFNFCFFIFSSFGFFDKFVIQKMRHNKHKRSQIICTIFFVTFFAVFLSPQQAKS